MFNSVKKIKLSPQEPIKLQVVIDTEEEFDWNALPNKQSTSVSAISYIDRVQSIFDQYGIKPCYVVDYAVASQKQGIDPLKEIFDQGRCELGAHLQPWVNPPFEEELSIRHMYPGNLPRDLEFRKLSTLQSKIKESFGYDPEIYKAGRYGLGNFTVDILSELGFSIDLSVCPPFDNRHDGGPDYSNYSADPFWFSDSNNTRMLEIPVTGSFVGSAGSLSKNIYNLAVKYKRFKIPAILSRLSIVDRLMLSPEGFTPEEHIKLTKYLLDQGVRVFTWSFHSPSVCPGNTPYVNTESELTAFLDSFKRYFDFFFGELGGEATSPLALKERFASQS